jgi:N6-adenosine-specific RNA methylase IME4
MEFHEYANLFPMMQTDELEDLVADVKQNGLIEPIVLYEDKILDGRNRFLACSKAGIKPRYDYYRGYEPVSYVISKNVQRRHLNGSQKAMIATEVKPALEKEARKRQLSTLKQNTDKELVPEREQGEARNKAGEMFGVSGRYVSDAEKIKREAPEFVQPIIQGEMTISQVKRELNRKEKIGAILEKAEDIEPINNIGKFPIIYADPPWRFDFPISDSRRIENQYPTQEIEDIYNLDVKSITTDDAILFLWTSTPFLKKGLRVLEEWGFEYRTSMVWVKPSIGLGQWVRQRHEYILIGVKGNIPIPKGSNKPDSVVEAPRQEHSKKPDVMYEIIEKMYPELPKVELFSRNQRAGWSSWGFEA